MSNHTEVQAKNDKAQVTLSSTSTDSPILPITQIEKLKELHPSRVDWFFEETSKEADFRRSESHRVNGFVFRERICGQIFGFLIGIFGLGAAVYAGVHGSPAVGCTIAGTAVISLVSAFVYRRAQAIKDESERKPDTRKRTK